MRYLVLILLLCSAFTKGRNDYSANPKTSLVYINYPDSSVHAFVLNSSREIKTEESCTYYWYTANQIKKTNGGYDGKLLHGLYKSFYADRNLKEKGSFSNGLKTGKWTSWLPGGKINTVSHFKNGRLQGSCEKYNTEGQLVQKSTYRNGLLHGITINYQNDTIASVIHYKKGVNVTRPSTEKHAEKKNKHSEKQSSKTKPGSPEKLPQDSAAAQTKSSFLKEKLNRLSKKTDSCRKDSVRVSKKQPKK